MGQKRVISDEAQIRRILDDWSSATRTGRRDSILGNHLSEALIYDVLAPMKYEGTEAYRRSWDEWQPETQGEAKFDFEGLSVTSGPQVAFAHGFIRCGGTMPNGETFEDLVRATFCFRKTAEGWKVAHQHISKPIPMGGG